MKRAVWLWLCAGMLLGWQQDYLCAQDTDIHTLHVYTNTVQIPTLVLERNREKVTKPITTNRFWVNFDEGPWFRATHARLEGDDPISLSILLDPTGAPDLMPKVDEAIANLAPLSLGGKDRVSIFALNCELTRVVSNAPADHVQLKDAVDRALESWTSHRMDKDAPPCKKPIHLWDAMAIVSQQLRNLPVWRVMLVVTDGKDKGSLNSWNELRFYDQHAGIAIFGVTPIPWRAGSVFLERAQHEDPFQSLCELSGGLVIMTKDDQTEPVLNRIMTMVRERYIVEFPRPANSSSGVVGIAVKIDKKDGFFIREAGATVPVPDAAVLADPTTVPSDPSHMPEIGKRHVMTKPN